MLQLRMLLIGAIAAVLMVGCTIQPLTPPAAEPAATAESTEEVAPEATEVPAEEASDEEASSEEVSDEGASAESPSAPSISVDSLKNLAYTLDIVSDEPIQLTDGVYEDTANRIYVAWIDTYAFGDLNGEPVAAVVLYSNTGGSGGFSILAIVAERDGEPVNIASALIGDRILMNWMTIADNEIKMEIVTQGPDEAMCCATQQTLVDFSLEDGELVSTQVTPIGVQDQISGTEVITFVPAAIPDATAEGSCFTNAIGLGREDAWRCTTTDNLIYDPCFLVEDQVVCGADPIANETGFVLELTEPLPAPETGDVSKPWIVQLADGTYCGLMTGTVPGLGDGVAPYGCTDEAHSYLSDNFLIYDPVWYAQMAVIGLGEDGFFTHSSVRVPVAKVWN